MDYPGEVDDFFFLRYYYQFIDPEWIKPYISKYKSNEKYVVVKTHNSNLNPAAIIVIVVVVIYGNRNGECDFKWWPKRRGIEYDC